MRIGRNGVFSLAGLTTAVAGQLGLEIGDLKAFTHDFDCACCKDVGAGAINTMLRQISAASGYELFPPETEPPRDLEGLTSRIVLMIRTLVGAQQYGTDLERETVSEAYVVLCLFAILHGGEQIYSFRRYCRQWYGNKYNAELADATTERFAAMVAHLTELCKGVPHDEPMPASYFPKTDLQRSIYLGQGGEGEGILPLTPAELKDLRERLVARHKLFRVTLLTDDAFLEVVAEVRAETAWRVAMAERIKPALVDYCVANFGLNPDQPLPVTFVGPKPDMSAPKDYQIEVGESDRVPGTLFIRVVSAAAEEVSAGQQPPFGIMEIRL